MGSCLGTGKSQKQPSIFSEEKYLNNASVQDPLNRKATRQETVQDMAAEGSNLMKAWLSNEKKLKDAYGNCPAFRRLDVYAWATKKTADHVEVVARDNPRAPNLPNPNDPQATIFCSMPCKVVGRLVATVPVGPVKIHFANGEVFEGLVVDGKYEGEGTFTNMMGQRFEGSFLRGKKHGPGTLIHPDGSRLKVTWNNDLKEGPAIVEKSDGSKLFCVFERDLMVGTAVELSQQDQRGGKVITLVENGPSFPPATTLYLSATRD